MKASGKFDPKMKYLKKPEPPQKDYAGLFRRWLNDNELSLEETLSIRVDRRVYHFSIKE